MLVTEKDRDDETLGFDFVFAGQNNTAFNVIFYFTGCFQKVNLIFRNLTYVLI